MTNTISAFWLSRLCIWFTIWGPISRGRPPQYPCTTHQLKLLDANSSLHLMKHAVNRDVYQYNSPYIYWYSATFDPEKVLRREFGSAKWKQYGDGVSRRSIRRISADSTSWSSILLWPWLMYSIRCSHFPSQLLEISIGKLWKHCMSSVPNWPIEGNA